LTALDRYLTPPEIKDAPEIDEDELMDDLLRDLWRKHAGSMDPAPFLLFAKAMEREGDFYEWFREGWSKELAAMRELRQERDDDGDQEFDRRRDDRLTEGE